MKLKEVLAKIFKSAILRKALICIGVVGLVAVGFTGCKCKHKNCEWITAKNPTCAEEGIKNYECLKCGEVITTEYLAKLNHEWGYKEYEAPTCANYGWQAGTACLGCDLRQDQSKRIDKLPHTIVEDEEVAPTCTKTGLTAGTHCSVCNEVVVAQTVIEATGHNFETTTNKCSACDVKEYANEIKTVNEFSEGIKYEACVVFLDQVVASNQSSNIVQSISPDCKYVRLIGSAGKTYPVVFNLEERSTAFTLDLVNAKLLSIGATSVISSASGADVHIGLYGEAAAIQAGKASSGSNDWGGSGGSRGADGCTSIAVSGNLSITVSAARVDIYGGTGGNGGNGRDGTWLQAASNGGNGGNGGMAISASSITVNFAEGYNKDNITIAGGAGGSHGYNGGDSWLGSSTPGVDGSRGLTSNVDITYNEPVVE